MEDDNGVSDVSDVSFIFDIEPDKLQQINTQQPRNLIKGDKRVEQGAKALEYSFDRK